MFLNVDYNNVEEYIDGMKGWNIDARKLDKHAFEGNLAVMLSPKVQIVKIDLNSSIKRYGLTPDGYVSFVIPTDSKQNYHWFNKIIDSRYIAKFPSSRDLDMYSKGSFSTIGLNIAFDHFHQLIAQYKFQNIENILNNQEQTFRLNSYKIASLANYIRYLFQLLNNKPTLLFEQGFLHQLNYYLPYSLLALLDGCNNNFTFVKSNKNALILQQASWYIEKNTHRKISVKNLAKSCSISENKLVKTFRENYGTTPLDYINRNKFNLIRQELNNNYREENINSIISKYGIKHGGQFSKSYYGLFNELPSNTINRNKILIK